jgi:asparagine synthase (glutamine-hydrolysing)
MDSSVVTAVMAEASSQPVRTFSIGFENETFDELEYARAVAKRYGTIHTEATVRLDAIELLPELADHFDEPFADSSAVPTFRVSQLAAQHLKVVLTGDGGDESFGGYSRYRVNEVLGNFEVIPGPVLRAMARAGRVAATPLGARSRLRRRFTIAEGLLGLDPDERYVMQMTSLDAASRSNLILERNGAAPYLLDVIRDGPDDPIDRLLRADLLTYLPEDLLVKMDRASMANSLEARSPLLDHHLVEFVARLPIDRKIDGRTTKVLLRAIAKRLMPAEHVDRPKMGFSAPIGDWFRGPLGDRYEEMVLAPDAASRDHLDQVAARAMLLEHRGGQAEHDGRLWSLLMFELWARRWLGVSSAVA